MKVITFQFLFFVTITLTYFGCSTNNNNILSKQPLPGNKPILFLPELIPDNMFAHCGVLSPRADEYFYTLSATDYSKFVIMSVKMIDGKLTEPKPAGFSGMFTDHAPSFSPDGKTMYFSSIRPDTSLRTGSVWHIWKVERSGESWNTPEQIFLPGIEDYIQSHSSVTNDNTLYFHLNPDNQYREMDLFYAEQKGNKYLEPKRVDATDSKTHKEITPYVSPDESYIIFTSYEREDGYGDGDLYISFKNEMDEWRQPINLGEEINTKYEESNPFVSFDDQFLFFSSTRDTEGRVESNMAIYWVNTARIWELKNN